MDRHLSSFQVFPRVLKAAITTPTLLDVHVATYRGLALQPSQQGGCLNVFKYMYTDKKKKKTRTTRKREQLSRLEEQCAHAAHVTLFLDEDFEVLVDDCDGKKDTRATANGTQEVGEHR